MFGRGASRIELRMEEDLQEYEEFKQMLQKQKAAEQMSKIAQITGAFGMIGGQSNSMLRPNAFTSYDQISNYANFQSSKGQVAGSRGGAGGAATRKKRTANNQASGMIQAQYTGSGGAGAMDDSMNDSF